MLVDFQNTTSTILELNDSLSTAQEPKQHWHAKPTFNNTYWETHFGYTVSYFLIWFLPLNIVSGLLGNAICLIFLMKSRKFPRKVRIWMLSICIGDSLILWTDALRMCIKVTTHFDIRDINTPICRVHNFLSNYSFYWSAFMQAGFSLQRLAFVISPLNARIYLPLSLLLIVWVVLTILPIFPNLLYILFWHMLDDCEPYDKAFYKVTSLCDLTIQGILPFTGMVVSTVLIRYKMRQNTCFSTVANAHIHRATISQRTDEDDSGNRDNCQTLSYASQVGSENVSEPTTTSVQPISYFQVKKPVTPNSSQQTPTATQKISFDTSSQQIPLTTATRPRHRTLLKTDVSKALKNFAKSDCQTRRVTRILITLNIFYLITTFPLLMYLLILNIRYEVGISIPQPLHRTFYYALRAISYLNCSCNWAFYLGGNAIRKVLLKLMKKSFRRFVNVCIAPFRHCILNFVLQKNLCETDTFRSTEEKQTNYKSGLLQYSQGNFSDCLSPTPSNSEGAGASKPHQRKFNIFIGNSDKMHRRDSKATSSNIVRRKCMYTPGPVEDYAEGEKIDLACSSSDCSQRESQLNVPMQYSVMKPTSNETLLTKNKDVCTQNHIINHQNLISDSQKMFTRIANEQNDGSSIKNINELERQNSHTHVDVPEHIGLSDQLLQLDLCIQIFENISPSVSFISQINSQNDESSDIVSTSDQTPDMLPNFRTNKECWLVANAEDNLVDSDRIVDDNMEFDRSNGVQKAYCYVLNSTNGKILETGSCSVNEDHSNSDDSTIRKINTPPPPNATVAQSFMEKEFPKISNKDVIDDFGRNAISYMESISDDQATIKRKSSPNITAGEASLKLIHNPNANYKNYADILVETGKQNEPDLQSGFKLRDSVLPRVQIRRKRRNIRQQYQPVTKYKCVNKTIYCNARLNHSSDKNYLFSLSDGEVSTRQLISATFSTLAQTYYTEVNCDAKCIEHPLPPSFMEALLSPVFSRFSIIESD